MMRINIDINYESLLILYPIGCPPLKFLSPYVFAK